MVAAVRTVSDDKVVAAGKVVATGTVVAAGTMVAVGTLVAVGKVVAVDAVVAVSTSVSAVDRSTTFTVSLVDCATIAITVVVCPGAAIGCAVVAVGSLIFDAVLFAVAFSPVK